MRVLFTTLRNTSHFLPLIPFIEASRRHGHEVAVAAPPDLAERVARTGAAFFPFGHPGDEGLRPIWTRLRGVSEEESKRLAIGELFAGACAGAALPGLLQTLEEWRPSIVVRESQEYAAVVGAEKFGIPRVRVAITAPSGERAIQAYAASNVDLHRKAAGVPLDPGGERIRAETVLTLFPASLDDPGSAPVPALRFRAPRNVAPPLPGWWPDREGPFVYATLGTVTGGMDVMRSAFGVVLKALGDLPIRVLLTIGADLPLDVLGDVPANVHVERFVAQDEVLPHATAVVCHGGSGTVLGTLAAGVPMVVVPQFADQPFNGERVAAVGAGLVMPTRTGDADALRSALKRVLDDPAYGVAARRVAGEMAALPLVDEAGTELEALAKRAS